MNYLLSLAAVGVLGLELIMGISMLKDKEKPIEKYHLATKEIKHLQLSPVSWYSIQCIDENCWPGTQNPGTQAFDFEQKQLKEMFCKS